MAAKPTRRWKASSKDRISRLPDDILSSILSLLPLEESVRSSIVSRRWKYPWKTYAQFSPSIDLNIMSMRANNYFNLNFHGLGNDETTLGSERRNFVRWVERMMQVNYNNDCVRNSFNLFFYMSKDFAENINQWINKAIDKGVHNFNIDFSTSGPYSEKHYEDLYTFPCLANETTLPVKCLSLKSLQLGPLDSKCFYNLVDLRLEQMHVELERFTKLLIDCLNIENLSLINTWGLCPPKLEILSPALKLKHLRLDRCCTSNEINIDAVNLARLEYVGEPVIFTFDNIPGKLSEVKIDFLHQSSPASLNYALGLLSKDTPDMESLSVAVTYRRRKDTTRRRAIEGTFANLNRLVLKIICGEEVLWKYIPVLHASPYLHRLELHLFKSASKSVSIPGRFADTRHDHLKEIMVTGFNGTCHEIEFVKYLLTNCKALEEMTIDTGAKLYDHKGRVCSTEAAHKKRKIEMGARRQLKNSLFKSYLTIYFFTLLHQLLQLCIYIYIYIV